MTTETKPTREEKAQELTVFRADENVHYVQSSDGKICYRVSTNGSVSCACGDYAANVKKDPHFQCKHILAVLNSPPMETKPERCQPKLDSRFIKSIQGRDFVLYSGLLDLAHQRGLWKLEVEPIQYPTKENGHEAIVKAIATSQRGEVFMDIGDANPGNCNKVIAQHVLRMASTRAKARVLRDYNNIGMTCLEELGDLNDVVGSGNGEARHDNGNGKRERNRKPPDKASQGTNASAPPPNQASTDKESSNSSGKSSPTPTSTSEKPASPPAASNANAPRMSDAQRRAVMNLSQRRGISPEELEQLARKTYGVSIEQLTSSDAAGFIRTLQQSA